MESRKRNVRMSRRYIHRDSPGGSMLRGQRIFRTIRRIENLLLYLCITVLMLLESFTNLVTQQISMHSLAYVYTRIGKP